MTLALRMLIGLWGVAFGLLGLRGLLDPQVFLDQFGVQGPGASINTIRADFGAFFLVSAASALWAAWKPKDAKLLYIPAALFAMALAGRLLGLALGDPASAANHQAMIIEGISVALLLFAARRLSVKSA